MATTFRNRVNKPLGVASLSAGINSSVLTITLTTGTGATLSSSSNFCISINDEIILIDSRSTDTLTVNASGRGYDDSTAASHSSGDAVYIYQIKKDFTDIQTAVNTLETTGAVDALAVGGGYGSTGLTVTSAGAISANGALIVDGASTLTGEVQIGGGYGSTGVTLSTAGAISADGATIVKGGITSQFGGASLIIGADNAASTLTNSTTKFGRILGKHYTNSEEDVATFLCESGSGYTVLVFGGGSSSYNAATLIDFYIGATNTTVTGTGKMRLDSTGLRIGSVVSATAALDVTGAALISTTLGVTGNTTLTGDLAVNGGDLTCSATTFNLVNATVTTLNIGGAADINMSVAGKTVAIAGLLTVAGNVTLGDASTDTITATGRLLVRSVTDAGPMTATDGNEREIVYNESDSKFYGCTVTGSPGTWVAFH